MWADLRSSPSSGGCGVERWIVPLKGCDLLPEGGFIHRLVCHCGWLRLLKGSHNKLPHLQAPMASIKFAKKKSWFGKAWLYTIACRCVQQEQKATGDGLWNFAAWRGSQQHKSVLHACLCELCFAIS